MSLYEDQKIVLMSSFLSCLVHPTTLTDHSHSHRLFFARQTGGGKGKKILVHLHPLLLYPEPPLQAALVLEGKHDQGNYTHWPEPRITVPCQSAWLSPFPPLNVPCVLTQAPKEGTNTCLLQAMLQWDLETRQQVMDFCV